MGAPTGSKGYVAVTINAAKVGETNSHFPWLYDLSKITDASWWSNITAAGDIVVLAPDGSTIVPRIVDVLDTTGKTGTILWDASVSTSANKTYQLHACPGYGAVNASAALTNSNCIIRHGLDGASSPLIDSCGNYNLTNLGATLAQPGKIGKSVKTTAGSSEHLATGAGAVTQCNGATKWTSSYVAKTPIPAGFSGSSRYLGGMSVTPSFSVLAYTIGTQTYLFPTWSGAVRGQLNNFGSLVGSDTWFHLTLVFDGSLSDNANRFKLYLNGALQTLDGFDGVVGTALPATNETICVGSDPNTWNSNIDEIRHYTDAKSAGWELTEYNSIFDAGAVTTGAWVPASSGGNGMLIGGLIVSGLLLGGLGIGKLARKFKKI